jgi:hypothetical protein
MQYFFLYLSPIAHLLNEFYYESLIVYFYFGMAIKNQKNSYIQLRSYLVR